MVRAAPGTGANVKNRGIGRGRMFMGALLLFAAAIAWGTAILMSPHGRTEAAGTEHVRSVVVVFLSKAAIGTLILSALSAYLLFPNRRPHKPARDWAIGGLIALLVVSSLYELVWLQLAVL
jgi:drug/metabolite transporter (DMT)-like permease